MQLLKIGGNEMGDPGFLSGLAATLSAMAEQTVVVHGGGKAIAELQARLGLEEKKVDGLRVTDAESLEVTQMVLSGQSNKLLVGALLAGGVDAVGLSGVDGGLLRCVKKHHPSADLGFVGQIVEVRTELIHALLGQGWTPVISPVSLGTDGQIYNVNADEAAGAMAAALGASALNFVSNVPGVLDGHVRLLADLTVEQARSFIDSGIIHSGMVPKVQAALAVIGQGVPQVRIVDLAGLAKGGGTKFSRDVGTGNRVR